MPTSCLNGRNAAMSGSPNDIFGERKEEFEHALRRTHAGVTALMVKHGLLDQAQPPLSMPNGVTLTRADLIHPEPVEWAWDGRIPLGMLTVVAGDPGLGKSTIALNLVAGWTRGVVPGALWQQPV